MPLGVSLVASLVTTGCLLSDPPNYVADGRIPPFVEPVGIRPEPNRVHLVSPNESRTFTATVRSNDTDEQGRESRLVVVLYRNYGLPGSRLEDLVYMDPATLADGGRPVALNLTFNADWRDGCYQVTLLITHETNYVGLDRPLLDEKAAATVTWWFSVEADETPNTLADCPVPGGT